MASTHRYTKVSRCLWTDAGFRSLSRADPNAQTLWLRLLTGPEHTIVPGLVVVLREGLAAALRWPLVGFDKAFAELSELGMAEADWSAGLVWLPRAIDHAKPESPNHLLAWIRALPEMPECDLRQRAIASIYQSVEGLGKTFSGAARGLAQVLREDYRKGSRRTGSSAAEDLGVVLPVVLPAAMAEGFASEALTETETKEGEKKKADPTPPAALFALGEPSLPRDVDDAHRSVLDAWIRARELRYPKTKGHRPHLDPARRQAVDAALKLGYSVDQLRQAVAGEILNADKDRSDTRTFIWALQDASAIDANIERWLLVHPESSTRLRTAEDAGPLSEAG